MGRKIQQGHQTVVAQYEVPARLSPAEIAYLYDRTFGQEELLATLLDLELRGKVRLSPIKGEKRNFRIDVLCKGNEPDLASHESDILLTAKHLNPEPTWDVLRTSNILFDNSFEKTLELSLENIGLLAPKQNQKFVHRILMTTALLLSFSLLFIPVRPFNAPTITDIILLKPAAVQTEQAPPDVLHKDFFQQRVIGTGSDSSDEFVQLDRQIGIVFIAMICFVLAFILYRLLRLSYAVFLRATNMEGGTKALGLLWPELEGYRIFLKQVELDRIRFENASDRQLVLNKTAPYAVALNLTTRWQDRFPG